MPLTGLAVDEGPHSTDGLLLHGWEGPARVEAFRFSVLRCSGIWQAPPSSSHRAIEAACRLASPSAASVPIETTSNALPTKLQREHFDNAGSMGELMETAALRGQIARFLHRYKNDDNPTAAHKQASD
jgi:hypothetical protein